MPSVDINAVILAPVSDLSDQLVFSHDLNMGVEVREENAIPSEHCLTAGGRSRHIIGEGSEETVHVSISYATRTEREALLELRDQFLLYRDYRGRCWFGMMTGFTAPERPGPQTCDLEFSFERDTYSIEV
jgi:hypothetical protein